MTESTATVLHSVAEMREFVDRVRNAGASLGLVPTMGALHEGHFSLIRRAVAENAHTVVSVYVNPTQFGPREDLDAYPRVLERDVAECSRRGVSAVFAPPNEVMYPAGYATYVEVEGLTEVLCGQSRPGHFRGVTTVVMKLLNIVGPDVAYFGEKDAQQACVIQQMVRDLNVPVRIEVCPIIREPDGLALSSRNRHLTPAERAQAPTLYRSLLAAEEMILGGERNAETVVGQMRKMLQSVPGLQIDYVELVDPDTLQPQRTIQRPVRVALAVRLGAARLIDNLLIE